MMKFENSQNFEIFKNTLGKTFPSGKTHFWLKTQFYVIKNDWGMKIKWKRMKQFPLKNICSYELMNVSKFF